MFKVLLLVITLLCSLVLAEENKGVFSITVGKSKDRVYKQKIYISKDDCNKKSENFIFADGECINYSSSEGDKEDEITIFFHAAYPAGYNVLNKYETFIENLSMETDITTIAVALPGYSKSSTNKFTPIRLKDNEDLILNKKFMKFISELSTELKIKFNAKKVNFIGHSSGAMIGALLSGYSPSLISKYILVGGRYDQIAKDDGEDFLSVEKVLNKINKNTKMLLVYGTKDKVSKPKISKEYFKLAKDKNLNIEIVEILNSPHLNLENNDLTFEEIIKMLE